MNKLTVSVSLRKNVSTQLVKYFPELGLDLRTLEEAKKEVLIAPLANLPVPILINLLKLVEENDNEYSINDERNMFTVNLKLEEVGEEVEN